MPEHLQLMGVNVIDDVFAEVIEEVDCDPPDPAERLEYTRDLPALEPLTQVIGDGLGDHRIPAFLVNPYAFLEPREEVVALIEVPIQLLGNPIPLLHGHRPVIIAPELEIFSNNLEIAAQLQQVIILPQHLALGIALNTK